MRVPIISSVIKALSHILSPKPGKTHKQLLNPILLAADRKVIEFHRKCKLFAILVNKTISDKNQGQFRKRHSSSALNIISGDCLTMHRANFTLCRNGWAFSSVLLIRTMLDMLFNSVIITHNKNNSDFMGFKYLHFFLKSAISDKNTPEPAKQSHRQQIIKGIELLNTEDQERAKHFIYQEKLRGYWYQPEFKGPSNILEQLSNPDIEYVYNTLSGGVHAGYLGLRLYRDNPDFNDPNPRADKRAQNQVLLVSSRLLLETFSAIEIFEGCDLNGITNSLMQELITLGPLYQYSSQ